MLNKQSIPSFLKNGHIILWGKQKEKFFNTDKATNCLLEILFYYLFKLLRNMDLLIFLHSAASVQSQEFDLFFFFWVFFVAVQFLGFTFL